MRKLPSRRPTAATSAAGRSSSSCSSESMPVQADADFRRSVIARVAASRAPRPPGRPPAAPGSPRCGCRAPPRPRRARRLTGTSAVQLEPARADADAREVAVQAARERAQHDVVHGAAARARTRGDALERQAREVELAARTDARRSTASPGCRRSRGAARTRPRRAARAAESRARACGRSTASATAPRGAQLTAQALAERAADARSRRALARAGGPARSRAIHRRAAISRRGSRRAGARPRGRPTMQWWTLISSAARPSCAPSSRCISQSGRSRAQRLREQLRRELAQLVLAGRARAAPSAAT